MGDSLMAGPFNYKCTIFFKMGDESSGWTESYYTQQVDHPTAMTNLQFLAQLRAQLLGARAALVYLRVSDDAAYRDSIGYEYNPALGTSITSARNAAFPNVSVLARLEASPSNRRPLYLRGVPSDIVQEPENLQ